MKRGTRRKVVVVAVGALCSITWLLRQRRIINDSLGLGSAPISSQQLLEPTIFHNIHDHGDFPPLRSSGPTVLNPNIPDRRKGLVSIRQCLSNTTCQVGEYAGIGIFGAGE